MLREGQHQQEEKLKQVPMFPKYECYDTVLIQVLDSLVAYHMRMILAQHQSKVVLHPDIDNDPLSHTAAHSLCCTAPHTQSAPPLCTAAPKSAL